MSALSAPVQAVVSLFSGPLASVRFADIDAAGLSNLAAEVDSAALEVAAHEAKLVELRQALAQRQEALLGLAQQALAYARVYAEGDDALSAELNAIALPRAAKPRKSAPAKTVNARDERTEASATEREPESARAETETASASADETETETDSASEAREHSESAADSEPTAEAAPKATPAARSKAQRRQGRAASGEEAV